VLLAVWSIWPASVALGQQRCEIEEAQRLFGQQPRPAATVERLLQACIDAGSTDYRIFMFQGVMARDAGDRERAIERLRKAHQAAPQELNPALELGFTLEAKHAGEAGQVYEDVLKRDPVHRPALLGLARVARSENRLEAARAVYERLLVANPNDPDALNGVAWLALANRDREDGRRGFERVLTIEPGNEEAKIGLSKVESVYRAVLDVDAGYVTTGSGNSVGFGGRGLLAISAFNTVELGYRHFTNELQTITAIGQSVLPSDEITVGIHRLMPLS
jgi:tetratricopeptide (TPR) repeat protein